MLLELLDVGAAAQEPEELVDDRAQVELLGGEDREALGQVEAHLVAEDRQGAGPGAVPLLHSLVEDAADQVEIGLHG
jgi:hypothetical protein